MEFRNDIDLNITLNNKQYSCLGYSTLMFSIIANNKISLAYHADILPFINLQMLISDK